MSKNVESTYQKTVVSGKLLKETLTHYIVKASMGTQCFNKKWYRLERTLD